ncbi:uncharacterized protein CMU_031730 [Cryptosporidium muris RN66]|uniref:Uncharacterized protein n=1 Tax=Cryptosporidium muris (strain RN66) TaxID=441375 RepID=B6AIJ1_CRYMR|nr:uncharacterized protein CMU_031730 [Cryptosporidium muris RN66]EEA08032.1 hypothetical protein CMU_031730 [Cryptosporidium muris RN66]|eukprot:XP_002142381.1 hypothetical protein [Cryptosporidium muris RN66]
MSTTRNNKNDITIKKHIKQSAFTIPTTISKRSLATNSVICRQTSENKVRSITTIPMEHSKNTQKQLKLNITPTSNNQSNKISNKVSSKISNKVPTEILVQQAIKHATEQVAQHISKKTQQIALKGNEQIQSQLVQQLPKIQHNVNASSVISDNNQIYNSATQQITNLHSPNVDNKSDINQKKFQNKTLKTDKIDSVNNSEHVACIEKHFFNKSNFDVTLFRLKLQNLLMLLQLHHNRLQQQYLQNFKSTEG